MTIDLSLRNSQLYQGCEIEEVAGQLNLITPPPEGVQLVGRNIATMLDELPASGRDVCVLTGAMAIWAYLVVFHAVVHCFREVCYDDGRNGAVVIARHG